MYVTTWPQLLVLLGVVVLWCLPVVLAAVLVVAGLGRPGLFNRSTEHNTSIKRHAWVLRVGRARAAAAAALFSGAGTGSFWWLHLATVQKGGERLQELRGLTVPVVAACGAIGAFIAVMAVAQLVDEWTEKRKQTFEE